MMHNSTPLTLTIVVWTDVSQEQMRKLDEKKDPESINEYFIKIFQLERNTKRTKILCDLFYYALNFARTNTFTHEQTSALLSILKRVHNMCISTPYANMEETYQYFKALILKHSLFRPPHNLRIFTPDLTKKVTEYVINTYFRHFKMYKYIFTATIDFSLNFTYEGMTRTEGETIQTTDAESIDAEEGTMENADLAEVRKLIQGYMKEELRKIENTTEELEVPSQPTEKSRRIKSSSSKPRTPK